MSLDFISGVLVHVGCGGRIGSLPGRCYGEGLTPEDLARNSCDRCGKVTPWELGETKWVYNLRYNPEILKLPGILYVGRAMPRLGLERSPWANPYQIGSDGREEALLRFGFYLKKVLASTYWSDYLEPLRTASGVCCWCVPEPCHSELLLAELEV